MTRTKLCIVLVAGIVTSLPALADCALPPPPSKIPDGATASQQEMVTAMNTLKEYNGDVNVYLKCLDFEAKNNRLSESDREQKNNSAVAQLQSIADKFNQQVRLYKSKHG
ncbi:MAG: hypothetical protein ACREUT_12050 [Steroidobacteraceae bacterium]